MPLKQNIIKITMRKIYYILTIILTVAFLLRFWGLVKHSPPLNRDEAAIGYNAYSLLLTGKDEHGISWPLAFKSIGDYKMPGYIYLTMLSEKIFGLTVFAVRFWSALAGVLAVMGLYLVSIELFKKMGKNQDTAKLQALIPAGLLAINPWQLHYSRLGFEANFNLTLFIWSIWFLLKGIKDNRFWIGTALMWVAMQFMYSSTFIFLPALITILMFLSARKIKSYRLKNKAAIILSITILVIGSIIALRGVAQVSSAKKSITVFSDPYYIDRFNKLRGQLQLENPLLEKIIYNKISYFTPVITSNYIKHYLPGFLFFNAINHPWHGIYGQGFFYLTDGIGFILGVVLLFKLLRKQKDYFVVSLLLSWLLLSPLASTVTIDAPHATRSLYLLPVFLIISGYGLWWLGQKFTNNHFSHKIVLLLFISVYLINFIKATYQYLAVYPRYQDKALFAGIKEVVNYAEAIRGERKVYMPEVSSSAYLYHLFYNQIDPIIVQQAKWKGMDTAGLTHIESVGSWRFIDSFDKLPDDVGKIIWIDRQKNQNPAGFKLLKQFSNPLTGIIEWGVYEN